ncbi:MAG: hypothetical protein A2X48_10990 [Lentisphaerae bacterium GWF2_49_21]|nr:MAG: hypothetical protein A2X48_10990 [Lentisphaerae bacterium GWF2_49_21]
MKSKYSPNGSAPVNICTKSRYFPILPLFLFLSAACFLSADMGTTPSLKNENPQPAAEARKESEFWGKIPFQGFKADSTEFKYKLADDGTNVLILVNFPTETEKRKHKPWKWDAVRQIYVEGEEKEIELYVVIAEFAADAGQDSAPLKMDVWIWRSARTDPSGYADDCYALSKSPSGAKSIPGESIEILQDEGTTCWFSRYFSAFVGEEVPRFYQRTPEGSASDVKAGGRWEKGSWTVEFSRKLDTGNKDDISLKNGKGGYLSLSIGAPSSKSLVFSQFIKVPDNKESGDSL